MDLYTESSWSQSISTLATANARDGDDEITLTAGLRRVTDAQSLIMTPEDTHNTSFYARDGSVQFKVTTKVVDGGKSNAAAETTVADFDGNVRLSSQKI